MLERSEEGEYGHLWKEFQKIALHLGGIRMSKLVGQFS